MHGLLQFVSMASHIAMQEKALRASSPQAPYVSTATANQAMNILCHFVHVFLILQLLQLHQQKPLLLKQFWDLHAL